MASRWGGKLNQYIFRWGLAHSDEKADRNLLGETGARLAEMSGHGLPVPPGFTITTEACSAFYKLENPHPADFQAQVNDALKGLESRTAKTFGDLANPLLLSVRAGSRASIPGMMDAVLNLGLNDKSVEGLAECTGDRRFAFDSYRRLIQMYSAVVLNIPHNEFEHVLDEYKETHDFNLDTEIGAEGWIDVIGLFKNVIFKRSGEEFPQDPNDQLWGAIGAAFKSWMNDSAVAYRRFNAIPETWGTAITVQSMVFGNMGDSSATGCAFTRNPSNGDKRLYGEYLINAQGDEVGDGVRTPAPISNFHRAALNSMDKSLEEAMPQAYAQLVAIAERLEKLYCDMQRIEFTVEKERLYILKAKSGNRTGDAAVQMAFDFAREGLIDRSTAISRVSPEAIQAAGRRRFREAGAEVTFAKGLPASRGVASGPIVLDANSAVVLRARGHQPVLVLEDVSPEDIQGIHASAAVVTSRGGMTSHAAVTSRGMGRPCVCGVGQLEIDLARQSIRNTTSGVSISVGEFMSVDADKGRLYAGALAMDAPALPEAALQLAAWAKATSDTHVFETIRSSSVERLNNLRVDGALIRVGLAEIIRSGSFPEVWDVLLTVSHDRRRRALRRLEDELATSICSAIENSPAHEVTVNIDWDFQLADMDQAPAGVSSAEASERIVHCFGPAQATTFPAIAETQISAIRRVLLEQQFVDRQVRLAVSKCVTGMDFSNLKRWLSKAAGAEQVDHLRTRIQLGVLLETAGAAINALRFYSDADFLLFDLESLRRSLLPLTVSSEGHLRALFAGQESRSSLFSQSGVEPLLRTGLAFTQHSGRLPSLEYLVQRGFEHDDIRGVLELEPAKLFVPADEVASWLISLAQRNTSTRRPG